MRTPTPAAILLLLIASPVFFPATSQADGLGDNDPDQVRPVPKVGIEVPAADRKKLEAGLAKLGALLEELRPEDEFKPDLTKRDLQRAWDSYADVAIFHRAARVALEDQEFFDPREIPAAKKLLEVGQERAEQLKSGETPWRTQAGLVVRGYMSVIDHTPQPFGMFIPESYDFERARPHRLDLWFHGRGETLSEANFITQRMSNVGPISPPNTFVLHPYGRYCNANKFAGEMDTFEALSAAQRSYRINPMLVAARGFSMGGAACWQFAVHYPYRWFAATPGAGFSETPEFLKFFQKETLNPPWWEEKLWRWYDCPGYVANLKNLNVVAYSGENDIQKQAADIMEIAYENEGMKLLHLIGPKTAHSIHPDAAKEIEEKLSEWAAAGGRSHSSSDHLEFVTYSLIYPHGRGVTLNGMKEQWEKASIAADRRDDGAIEVKTLNVTAMSLPLREWGRQLDRSQLTIDGESVPQATDSETPYNYIFENGRWKHAPKSDPSQLKSGRKNPRICGPIDHAFMNSFIFVKPSQECAHPEVQKWVDAEMNRAIREWRRQMRGDARVKLDSEVTDDDVKNANLVLWGNRQANSWIAEFADKLPIQWDDAEITVGDEKFDAANHALIAIYPNPKNPFKYIVLNSGFTYREYDYLNNARQTPKLPDWAVVDLRTPPNSRWPGKIVAADFFDEEWKLKVK